jgi:localization factor PodJL
MKFGVRWNVRGVRPEARDTARKAAQRSGMSVAEWLNEAIAEQAAEDGVGAAYDDTGYDEAESAPRRPARARAQRSDNEHELAAVSERLAQSIERIDRRLDNLTAQMQEPRPAGPEAYAPPRYWSQPAAQWSPPSPRDDFSRDVDAAVAQISARQRALDADPESAPLPMPPAFGAREDYTAPAAPQPGWTPHWPAQDLSGLERQLRQITEQIKGLNRPSATEDSLSELRNDLREIARSITEAMPRKAIDALEAEMRRLTEQLAQGHQAGVEAGTIGDMARNLLEVRDALRQLTPAENLAGFADTINALAHKIDMMGQPGGQDAGNLHQLESAIGALRGVVSHVASNETLAQLADEVRGLSMRIEHVAVQASDRTLGPELEAQLRAFTQQLQTQQGGGDGFGQLQERIASLSSKLDASDARLSHLDTIERELRGIMDHLGDLRGGGNQPRTAPAVDTLQRDLSRTQDSVEAVHGTVDHVVDRLAEIEREMRQDQPTRDLPRAVPKLAIPIEPEAPREPGPKMGPPPKGPRVPIDPSLPGDYPLEPGTGVPQARIVPSAAERIAASEAAIAGTKPAAAPTNFIAAARKAAQAASPEGVAEQAAEEAPAGRKSLSQRMRRLLGGAAAILILVGGYHVAPKFISNPLGGMVVLDSTADAQKLAAKALEPDDDEDDEPALAAPESRPVPLPRTVEAVPTWVSPVKMPDMTGSIPKAAPAHASAPLAPLTLPDNPTGTPSAKLPPQLREAALAGDPLAAYDVAMRYFDGRGVTASTEEAARWLQKAAKGGLAPAQFRLGSLYEKGQGVPKNLDAARQLYLAASGAGNAKAMHNLAVLHAEGLTGKSDYKAAAVWFLKAAQHGVSDSQYNLGILYARGIGVEQNLPESYKWFSLAAAQGDRESAKKRDDVAARLDAGAIAAAKLAIKSFVAQPQPEEAVTVKLPEEAPVRAPAPKPQAPKKKTPGPLKISPT